MAMAHVQRSVLTLLSLSLVSLVWLIFTSSPLDFFSSSAPLPTKILFHAARGDRSGATIEHMLLAHAYAFQNNMTYGGACFSDPNDSQFYVPDHTALIDQVLGLRDVLPFACPTKQPKKNVVWVEEPTYYSIGTRLFTPEWLAYMQSVQSPSVAASVKAPRPQLVVHMRRGDVDLCEPTWSYRYLPNSYYLQLIQQEKQKDASLEVSVYSESQSTEPWNTDDDALGTSVDQFHLDAPLVDSWQAMRTADVLILSCSSFSYVPAMFNWHGRIIYTPFWEGPLQHWHVVDDDTMQRMQKDKEQLKTEICPA